MGRACPRRWTVRRSVPTARVGRGLTAGGRAPPWRSHSRAPRRRPSRAPWACESGPVAASLSDAANLGGTRGRVAMALGSIAARLPDLAGIRERRRGRRAAGSPARAGRATGVGDVQRAAKRSRRRPQSGRGALHPQTGGLARPGSPGMGQPACRSARLPARRHGARCGSGSEPRCLLTCSGVQRYWLDREGGLSRIACSTPRTWACLRVRASRRERGRRCLPDRAGCCRRSRAQDQSSRVGL